MLYIHASGIYSQEKIPNYIMNTSGYFDAGVPDEWLDDDQIRRIITDIDKIDVMDKSHSTRTLLALNGQIPVEYLANGTKNLILCKYETDLWHRFAHMGENCYHWLMDIAENVDVHMVATRFFAPTDNDIQGRQIYFPDIGLYANSFRSVMESYSEVSKQGFFKER